MGEIMKRTIVEFSAGALFTKDCVMEIFPMDQGEMGK
jgi:hypothetical protein